MVTRIVLREVRRAVAGQGRQWYTSAPYCHNENGDMTVSVINVNSFFLSLSIISDSSTQPSGSSGFGGSWDSGEGLLAGPSVVRLERVGVLEHPVPRRSPLGSVIHICGGSPGIVW